MAMGKVRTSLLVGIIIALPMAAGGVVAGIYVPRYYGLRAMFAIVLAGLAVAVAAVLARLAYRCEDCGKRVARSMLRGDESGPLGVRRIGAAAGMLVFLGVAAALAAPLLHRPVLALRGSAGTYSAEVPRTHHAVEIARASVSTPMGFVEWELRGATNDHTTIALFAIARMAFPPAVLATAAIGDRDREMLRHAIEGGVGNMGCDLVRVRELDHGGIFPGLEGTFAGTYRSEPSHGRARAFRFRADVIFLMFAGHDAAVVDDPDGLRFLDSLVFDERPAARPSPSPGP